MKVWDVVQPKTELEAKQAKFDNIFLKLKMVLGEKIKVRQVGFYSERVTVTRIKQW